LSLKPTGSAITSVKENTLLVRNTSRREEVGSVIPVVPAKISCNPKLPI